MKGFDILYLDSNKPTVRRPVVKFVTLVSFGVGAGFLMNIPLSLAATGNSYRDTGRGSLWIFVQNKIPNMW
jgi:hypothetical protein